MGSFYIQTKGQAEIDLTQRLPSLDYLDGIFTPNFVNAYQENSGTDGSQLTSVSFGRGAFTANFFMAANSYTDHQLLRHELYQLFGQRQLMRVRSGDDPDKCFYGRPTNFPLDSLAEGNNDFKFQITFEVSSGFMHSVRRSDQIKEESFGMNLIEPKPIYNHSDNHFLIYNASDIKLDPYYQRHDLKINMVIDGPVTITNKTNGTSWSYKEKLTGKTSIVLDGLITYKEGKQATMNTDFGFIQLEVGQNEIVVSGTATIHDVTFSFPYLYLS
ncbi:phage tail family protein [Weissella minor]|uniref:phage tail domain-containing protein n=1 Tax=Weissella minor TaxID=1620 RepID=UPI001BAF4040|nr:phage tail domain-containing protein [Weissella minor]MBS0950058.1 phage tail family protein [Weissella minor]